MAVGLSFDYAGHITHAFVDSDKPTRVERSKDALSILGVSVLNGGTSTALGVMVLGFANSSIFRIFFTVSTSIKFCFEPSLDQGFMGIVCFGLVVGLAFLPSVLSFIGPGRVKKPESKPEQVELNELQVGK